MISIPDHSISVITLSAISGLTNVSLGSVGRKSEHLHTEQSLLLFCLSPHAAGAGQTETSSAGIAELFTFTVGLPARSFDGNGITARHE